MTNRAVGVEPTSLAFYIQLTAHCAIFITAQIYNNHISHKLTSETLVMGNGIFMSPIR